MSEPAHPSPLGRFLMGLACATCGILPILAAFDVGPLQSSSINGPPWLGVAAGGVFVIAAMFLWWHDSAHAKPWLGGLFALASIAGLAAVGNWVAFGVGTRECSGGVAVGPWLASRSEPDDS